jgi:hypothetical protein
MAWTDVDSETGAAAKNKVTESSFRPPTETDKPDQLTQTPGTGWCDDVAQPRTLAPFWMNRGVYLLHVRLAAISSYMSARDNNILEIFTNVMNKYSEINLPRDVALLASSCPAAPAFPYPSDAAAELGPAARHVTASATGHLRAGRWC